MSGHQPEVDLSKYRASTRFFSLINNLCSPSTLNRILKSAALSHASTRNLRLVARVRITHLRCSRFTLFSSFFSS